MAAAKKIKTLAGTTPSTPSATSSLNPVTPLNQTTILAAILQLQATVDELITRFNAHTHTENVAGTYAQNATTSVPGALVAGGAGVASPNLFTTN